MTLDKLLFLDIDGVLNNGEWMKDHKDERRAAAEGDAWWLAMIDEEAVKLLNQIIERTGAKVVISSTWRLRHAPEDMQRLLNAKGFIGEVIDRTPRGVETKVLRDGAWFGPKMSLYPQRGEEITYWLHLNRDRLTESIKFAVIDDNSDMKGVHDRFVKTYWQHWEKYPEGPLGLSQAAVDQTVALLNEAG